MGISKWNVGQCIRWIAAIGVLHQAFAIENGLLRTPPMGWNSWNIFHENINETQIKQIADVMVSSGMKDAGYIYLNLDDNWMATSRDANGNLRADPTRFPSGMKALAAYIHNKGLKFGLYGDRGLRTCHHYNMNIPNTKSGSYGNEDRDAKTFASWDVDYLKYDNCEPAPGSNQQADYEKMRDALANSGRPIAYSVCAWGYKDWAPKTGNLWRTTGDISDKWDEGPTGFFRGIINIIDENEKLAPNAKPGAWNDPDMLQVGNGKSTTDEYRTQFAMWSMMAAPLLAGNDIRTMSQTIKDILLNKEIIAIDQDSAGIQGRRVKAANGLEIWSKPLGSANSSTKAVALLNRNAGTQEITVNFADLGYSATEPIAVRDLWAKTDKGQFKGSYTMSVPSHGTGMLKLVKASTDTIPGRVEAENFITMEGIQTEPDDAGGVNVGYINTGDWTRYKVFVKTAGSYLLRVSVATAIDTNNVLTLKNATGKELGSITVNSAKTDGWHEWYTDSTMVELEAGEQELLLEFTGTSSYLFNIDWFELFEKKIPVTIESIASKPIPFALKNQQVEGGILLSILAPTKEVTKLQIFSTQGKTVFERLIQGGETLSLTNNNALPKGHYYATLISKGVQVSKISLNIK